MQKNLKIYRNQIDEIDEKMQELFFTDTIFPPQPIGAPAIQRVVPGKQLPSSLQFRESNTPSHWAPGR